MPSVDPVPTERALGLQRAEVLALTAALERDFAALVEASEASNADDEHDVEGASIAFERAQLASALLRSRERLAEVDGALADLASGSYGTCARCGRAIPSERLTARPTTRTCVGCTH